MNAALDTFIDELRALPGAAGAADELSDLLAGQPAEALKPFAWIAGQPRPLVERLQALGKLIDLKGPVLVYLPELFNQRQS